MRIAMIGQKGIPSRAGGIEIHVQELASRLSKTDCEVVVYCRKGYCEETTTSDLSKVKRKYVPYIRTKHLDAISHTFWSTLDALFSGCDIFHYHALGPSTLAFIPKLFGKKVICTVHGLDWQRGKWGGFATRFLKFGEFATAKFANFTINVSKNLVDYYKKKYGVDTYFIPNGIEEPVIREPDIINKKYGLDKKDYILFLARLVPEKGAHYLIDAFKRVNTKKRLVIAGGASHSDDYVDKLHQQASDDERIIFTGFVSGDELSELYSNAYIYVLPSDIEGMPISLLEAMSYGNTCLVSDIPENLNVIEDKGFHFEKSNPDDLYAKLELLLQNGNIIESRTQETKDFVLSTYNWENITMSTFLLYEKVLKKKEKLYER